ncbi:MAG TPA: DUF1553 domain-containing protein [Gemmataceae bacterium]|nr:DUF1553 domain-containing protein [Gemmataceae bacterium]
MMRTGIVPGLSIFALLLAAAGSGAESPAPIRFGRDILPILSENCFKCHGPDEKARKAKLRLDVRESAMKVVEPGKSDESEMIRRVFSSDPKERMPPPKSNRTLTAEQKDLLKRWIDQGARWGKHWAYETPTRPALPKVKNGAWPRNGIDFFVLARLEKEGMTPSPEASKETLIRRVSLDLAGLPPTLKEIEDFLADGSADAYERVVDRLLASPHYGERMAMDWLDDARYADTNGYQNDFARTMWPWRDGVIDALNRNIPFDQFVIEQIAGDLLPNATLPQKIASGFNRNNRTVTEAGSIDDEWRVENNVDRVETTATVFLGLTMGCARCHDHKYDPILQKEFYQFFAYFNSINEQGVYTEQRGNVPPLVAVPTPENQKRLQQFDAAIAEADKAVHTQEALLEEKQHQWEQEQRAKTPPNHPDDFVLRLPLDGNLQIATSKNEMLQATYRGKGEPVWRDAPFGKCLRLDGQENSFLDAGQSIQLERNEKFSYGAWVKPEGNGAVECKMDDAASYRGFDLLLVDGRVEVHLVHSWPGNAIKVSTKPILPQGSWNHVLVTYDGSSQAAGLKIYINGEAVQTDVHENHLTDTIVTAQPLRVGKRSTSYSLKGELADVRFYRRTLTLEEAQRLASQPTIRILQLPPQKRVPEQQKFLTQTYRDRYAAPWKEAKRKVDQLRKEKAAYEKTIPTVMVMEELPKPRDTYLLKRGRYDMPDKNQKVQPGTPTCLPAMKADAPANRLGLARWLVGPENPLTARVTVNRYWQRYFGAGLVKTSENFGLQSEPPSHPDLLDWLATEFLRTGWNVKEMQKLIVMSATYRQSSRETPELLQKDPDNRLLARGSRFRLPAELVRDNALAISGLLTDQVGGPPIKPYQPAGLWEELAGGAGEGPYVQDKGPNLYRRSLYIYRKRTVPHPEMATLDAPSREICQVKRARTNTPLQALELMNDVTYVEAARRLAQLMLSEGGPTAKDRIEFAFRRAVARRPTSSELQVLERGLERYRNNFHADPESAKRFIRHGESPVDDRSDPVELAAYTATAEVILNLDETMTKE